VLLPQTVAQLLLSPVQHDCATLDWFSVVLFYSRTSELSAAWMRSSTGHTGSSQARSLTGSHPESKASTAETQGSCRQVEVYAPGLWQHVSSLFCPCSRSSLVLCFEYETIFESTKRSSRRSSRTPRGYILFVCQSICRFLGIFSVSASLLVALMVYSRCMPVY
jgi:hypothetical protein